MFGNTAKPGHTAKRIFSLATAAALAWLAIPFSSPPAGAQGSGGLFTALTPVRALDTRATTPMGALATRTVALAGSYGVASDATAVSLNITVVAPTLNTYITVWPSGLPMPGTSTVNIAAGKIRPNATIVKLNNGAIDIFNFQGSTNVIVDVNGWFSAGSPAAGGFVGVTPVRILDTRFGVGRPGTTPVGPDGSFNLVVGGQPGVPTTNVSAVALNVTATEPSENTFVTVYPQGLSLPGVSSLNPAQGETSANLVIVPLSADGRVTVFNKFGTVHVIADVMGYFVGGSPGVGGFVPVTPVRVFDSRSSGPIPAKGWRAIRTGGVAPGLPADGIAAIAANLVVTGPSAAGYFSTVPTGAGFSSPGVVPFAPIPAASTLNFTAGQTVPNASVVKVGPEGSFWAFNSTGNTHFITDVSGYWIGPVISGNTPPPPAVAPGAGGFTRLQVTTTLAPLFWDTCHPIPWYIDTTGGTTKGLEEVFEAMERVVQRTNLPFVFGGYRAGPESATVFNTHDYDNRAIYVRWRSSTEDPRLAGSTIAVTSTFFYTDGAVFASLVTMRTDINFAGGFGPGTTWGSVLIHELGHSMGLGHTNDLNQIMYPAITSVQDEYGAGDLTALQSIVVQGCTLRVPAPKAEPMTITN